MSNSVLSDIQSDIREIAAPLVERYERVKKEIDERERDLDGLRKARTQLAKVIRNIDPTLIEPPNYGPKRNGKSQPRGIGLRPERLRKLTDWLQGNAEEVNEMNDGLGFHAAGLFRTYGSEIGIPDSSMSLGVRALHDQGLLRLNATGNGGAKFYKVIEPVGT